MPLRVIKNLKSFEKCRTCSHSYISHTDFIHAPSVCQYIVDGNCRCPEFLPIDNLKYLEYLDNKRQG